MTPCSPVNQVHAGLPPTYCYPHYCPQGAIRGPARLSSPSSSSLSLSLDATSCCFSILAMPHPRFLSVYPQGTSAPYTHGPSPAPTPAVSLSWHRWSARPRGWCWAGWSGGRRREGAAHTCKPQTGRTAIVSRDRDSRPLCLSWSGGMCVWEVCLLLCVRLLERVVGELAARLLGALHHPPEAVGAHTALPTPRQTHPVNPLAAWSG